MKSPFCIDRSILVLNNNPTYLDFWEYSSRIWKNNFGILPTLFFVGEPPKSLNKQFGEVYVIPQIDDVVVNPSRDWSVTWALFWGASQFTNDICITHGIDQVPLSDNFFRGVEKFDYNKDYVIGLADAYNRSDWFVSSHHVAKGSTFKKALSINEDWKKEVTKVFSHREDYGDMYGGGDFWGLDELHSSFLLKDFKNLKPYNGFSDLRNRRIDRAYHNSFDPEILKSGGYSEIHAHRPYNKHKNFLDSISRLTPNYLTK